MRWGKRPWDAMDAFLAQQNDVMDAVQRMRTKAQEKGNLKSNKQMKVETMTRWWCTARRLIPTHPSPILLRAITLREWRSLSVLAWLWERLGVEAGAITPAGEAEIITSRLITIIIITAIQTSTAETATQTSAAETIGNITPNIAVARPTPIKPQQISTAVQPVGRPPLTVKPTRGNNNLANRAAVGSRPAQWIAAALVEAGNNRVPAVVATG